MARIAISGALGRMGQMIAEAARADASADLICGIDRAAQDGELPIVTSADEALGRGVDVVIDFSLPAGTMACLAACQKAGAGLVIGTTGHDEAQLAAIAAASKSIPILRSPNMSVGVNVLYELLTLATRLLGPAYDISIVEGHHKHKLDRPSGTALKMADVIEHTDGRRPEIAVFRGGEVVGEHTALYLGSSDRIEITHRASSRRVFAEGAVRAACWLAGRSPGLYEMKDVLA